MMKRKRVKRWEEGVGEVRKGHVCTWYAARAVSLVFSFVRSSLSTPNVVCTRSTHAASTQHTRSLTQHPRNTHAAPTQHPRSTHAAPTQHPRNIHAAPTSTHADSTHSLMHILQHECGNFVSHSLPLFSPIFFSPYPLPSLSSLSSLTPIMYTFWIAQICFTEEVPRALWSTRDADSTVGLSRG